MAKIIRTENYQSRFTFIKKFNLGIFNEDFKVYKIEEEIKNSFIKIKNLDKKIQINKNKEYKHLNKFQKIFQSLSFIIILSKNINPNSYYGNLKRSLIDKSYICR